jgi:hypothetical protein
MTNIVADAQHHLVIASVAGVAVFIITVGHSSSDLRSIASDDCDQRFRIGIER